MHPTSVGGSFAHAACVACTVSGCVMVPDVRRKSSGPCAGADDALPNRQRSANDRPHGGTVVTPDRVAVLVLLVPDWCGHPMAIAKREPRPSATPGSKAGPKIFIRLGGAGGPCFPASVSCRLGGGCRMAHGVPEASAPSPAPPPAVSYFGLSAASQSARGIGCRQSASA